MPTSYKTKAYSVGDITVTVSKAGKTGADKVAALLEWISEQIVDPGFGQGGGSPDNSLPGGGGSGGSPDNTLPGGGARPDQDLPSGGARPDQDLPGGGARPGQGLPPSGSNKPGSDVGRPDQSLPGQEFADFLKEQAEEIAKAVLKGTLCDPAAQPKK
jgi:hypothetical protein